MIVKGPSMQRHQVGTVLNCLSPISSLRYLFTSKEDMTPSVIHPKRNIMDNFCFFPGSRFMTASDMGIDAMKLTAKLTTKAMMPKIVGLTSLDPSMGKR